MARSSDFLLTPEELRLRRQKRRRLFIGALSLLLLLLLLLLLGRPASHAIKRWQARRHAEKAFHFIDEEKWNEAQKEATAAYQLAPNEPQATRAVARFLSRVRQPQALEFWDRLAKQDTLTREDLRDEAGLALALGETGRAAATIKSLMPDDGREAAPADWLLAAQLAAERGAPNESSGVLQHVFDNPAASSRERLQAAALELRLSAAGSEQDQKKRADAWQRLEQISRGKDAASLDALVLLAQRALTGLRSEDGGEKSKTPAGSPGLSTLNPQLSTAQLASALEHHPLAKTPQQLLAVDLRIHASPNEKEKLVQAAIERWKGADNDALATLAKWLNGKGEFERELDAIPLERSLETRDLFLQHVDALGALDRWGEIKQLLENERFPLDPTIEHMYLARCSAQLGEKAASENNWQRALEAANGDASKLMTLADYAGKNGATAIAARAYDGAIATAPRLRSAWQGKLRLAQSARDTKAIHAVLAEMLKIWPNDTAIQNDEAYTRLLLFGSSRNDEARNPKSETSPDLSTLNSELSTVEQIAQRLVQRDPTSLPHRTLLALVYLKENRPATALGVYENLHVPPNALTPSALAVHAAVLQANGNTAAAAQEAGQIPRSTLLPEEAELISNL